jgi:replicative DNA helicase
MIELVEDEEVITASIEAEKTILGAILLDNDVYMEAAKALTANDFYLDSHQQLFSTMGHMIERGIAVDLVTLVEELRKTPALTRIGGIAYCADLTYGLPRRLSIADYLRIVKEKSNLRQLMKIAEEMISQAGQCNPSIDIGREAVKQIKEIFQTKKH